MAVVTFRLSAKTAGERSEVLVRFYHGVFDERAKTGVFALRERWNEKERRLSIPRYFDKKAIECAETQRTLDDLRNRIMAEYAKLGHTPPKGWLRRIVGCKSLSNETLCSCIDKYVCEKGLAKNSANIYNSIKNRVRASIGDPPIGDVSTEHIARLKKDMQATLAKNSVKTMLTYLKTVLIWCRKMGLTETTPFDRVEIERGTRHDPYFLTIEERNRLTSLNLPNEKERKIRDMFILQCHIGCRFSDLISLTETNITDDGFVEYIQKKKLHITERVVRVPLTTTAKEIVKRYSATANGGTLFNKTHEQTFYTNVILRRIMKKADITRTVQVVDSHTGKRASARICDIATTHLARRTFMANLYKSVKSERIVTAFTGHSPNSTALSSYITVDDDMKRELLASIE